MRVRGPNGTEPPGARESGRASARPRPCARRERALTPQVTRARAASVGRGRREPLSATCAVLCSVGEMVKREGSAL